MSIYDEQIAAENSSYDNIVNNLNKSVDITKQQYGNSQADLTNKYNNLYTGLDQDTTKAQDTAYTGDNTVDTTVNENLNRVNNIMARNGWLGGGENLQAQLNSNSDRMNGRGRVGGELSGTLQTILNNRNTYKANQTSEANKINTDQQNALNTLNGQLSSALADKLSRINSIKAAAQQAAAAAAQAAASRAAASAKSAKASADKAPTSAQLYNAGLESLAGAMDSGEGYLFLRDQKGNLINDMGQVNYNKLVKYYQDNASNGDYGAYTTSATLDKYSSSILAHNQANKGTYVATPAVKPTTFTNTPLLGSFFK